MFRESEEKYYNIERVNVQYVQAAVHITRCTVVYTPGYKFGGWGEVEGGTVV